MYTPDETCEFYQQRTTLAGGLSITTAWLDPVSRRCGHLSELTSASGDVLILDYEQGTHYATGPVAPIAPPYRVDKMTWNLALDRYLHHLQGLRLGLWGPRRSDRDPRLS